MICELSISVFFMVFVVGVVIWHILLTKESQIYKQMHEIRTTQQSMTATQRSQEKFMVELESKVQSATAKCNLLKEDVNKRLADLEEPMVDIAQDNLEHNVEQLELRIQQLEAGLSAIEPKKPKKDK